MFFPASKSTSFLFTLWLKIYTAFGKYCPVGYDLNPVTETCWYIEPAAKSWFDAKTSCVANGGKLGVYSDATDQAMIWARWGNRRGHIWMAVNDLDELGVHRDVDGNLIQWSSWLNEGENNMNGERCVLMSQYHLGNWGDYPCSTLAQSVCMTAEVTSKVYYKLQDGTQLYRDEITTYSDIIPTACHVLCASTDNCMSVAKNGTNCKLLKYGVTLRSFPNWDLYH